MATTGTEKHFRLCLVLMKAGTKACCCLLLNRVKDLSPVQHEPFPWTVDDFLRSRKKQIIKSKLGKEKVYVLFPKESKTDLSKWDLSLFCGILTECCELSKLTCLDVERLRTLRNELCHVHEPTVNDEKYQDYLKTITVAIRRIVDEIDDECIQCEIKRIVNDTEKEPLSLDETIREMHAFYTMERNIQEKLDQMSEVEEQILAKVEKFDRLLETKTGTIDENFEKLNRKLDDKQRATTNTFIFPDINVHIEFRNVSHEKEEKMAGALVQLFDEAINENKDFKSKLPADSFVKLREVVNRTVQLFLSKGWNIVKTKQKCVQLNIRCQSFASLVGLCRECIQGTLELELEELKSAISDMNDNKNIQLETVIYKDEFWNAIDETLSTLEVYRSQSHETNVECTEDVQTFDGTAELSHSVIITTRKTPIPPIAVNAYNMGDLHTCLKAMEKEIGNEFDVPDVYVKAGIDERQSPVQTNDAKKGEELAESTFVPINEEIVPDSPLQNYAIPSETRSIGTSVCETIAILELYRAQRTLANYLELASIHLFDNPDIAKEVLRLADVANKQHVSSMSLMENMQNLALTVKRKLWLLSDAISVQNAQLLKIVLKDIVPVVFDLETETKELQKSYTQVQTSVNKTIELCKDVRRKYLPNEERLRDQQLQSLIEQAHEVLFEEKQIMQANLKKLQGDTLITSDDSQEEELLPDVNDLTTDIGNLEVNDEKSNVKQETNDVASATVGECLFEDDQGRNIHHKALTIVINESILKSSLQPRTAMTGGIKGTAFGKRSHPNVFDTLRRNDSMECLQKLYYDSDSPTVQVPLPSAIDRVHKQNTEAIARLKTVTNLDGLQDVECLREVYGQLRYIDTQLERVISALSDMKISMEVVLETLSTDYSKLEVPLFSFIELNYSLSLDWSWFESLCRDYRIESDLQMKQLYEFLKLPVDKMASEERLARAQQLVRSIEEETKNQSLIK